jgi:hypothetical protein
MSRKNKKEGYKNLIILLVVAISVYIGFEPLLNFAPSGIARSVISSSFGAIFVIVLTMYLLTKQTEIEQESKKSERVFDEKIKLYQRILDILRDMLVDSKISEEEINRLPFPSVQLQIIAGDRVITAFVKLNSKLNAIYGSSEESEVEINHEDRNEIYDLLMTFAGECRLDLEISEQKLDVELVRSATVSVAETGKKAKNLDKFVFDDVLLPKNRYIFTVIKSMVNEREKMSLDEFEQLIPRNTEFQKNIWVSLDEAGAAAAKGRKRHYLDSQDQIVLTDAIVCISNGQTIDGTLKWIDYFKSNNIRTE